MNLRKILRKIRPNGVTNKAKVRKTVAAWRRARSRERNVSLSWVRDQVARGVPRDQIKDLSAAGKAWQDQHDRWYQRRKQASIWLLKHAPAEYVALMEEERKRDDPARRAEFAYNVAVIEGQLRGVQRAIEAYTGTRS